MAGRSFTEIKKSMTQVEFMDFAKKITIGYANSEKEYSQSQIAENYDLTDGCVRKLMDYSIINSLVDRKTACLVKDKSIENQQRNHPEAGGSSVLHHKELIKQREEKIVAEMHRKYIKNIIETAVSTEGNYEELVRVLGFESMRVFQLVLERGIAEGIASDNETMHLVNRSLKKNGSPEIRKYFDELIKKRQENRKNSG